MENAFENNPTPEIQKQLLDDLIAGGMSVSKTELKDGKLEMGYIDPISPEVQAAIYNAEYKDSEMGCFKISGKDMDDFIKSMSIKNTNT